MTYTVRVLRRAEDDLSEIYDQIAENSPGQAVAMVERVLDRIESLGELPNRSIAPLGGGSTPGQLAGASSSSSLARSPQVDSGASSTTRSR